MEQKLQFTRWELGPDVSLSEIFPDDAIRRGIYVLEFDDGDAYVGQTTDVSRRFADRGDYQSGVVTAILFAAVPDGDLNALQTLTIDRYRADKRRLRNALINDVAPGTSPFDLVVEPRVQAAWLTGKTTTKAPDIGDRHANAPERPVEEAGPFATLRGRPDYSRIVTGLADYVGTVIPLPHTSEGLWVATAMPSTGGNPRWRRLAAISINNVDVLVLGEWKLVSKDEWVLGGSLNVAAGYRMPAWSRPRLFDAWYPTTGAVTRLEFDDPEDVGEYLGRPRVRVTARTLVIALLRKGKGVMGQDHSLPLADAIFADLATRGRGARSRAT
jgi:hypothetical protein